MKLKEKVEERIKPLCGFIGTGWIGKSMSIDFENRGYKVIRYSLEEPHIKNKEKIKECDIVFIAVPTSTTPDGFDLTVLKEVLPLIGRNKTAVIKSTIIPGMTKLLQSMFPNIYILHSPEFLTESTAVFDSANPNRNIIGCPEFTDYYRTRAKEVMDVLPYAPYSLICDSTEAEFIKYGGNCWFYFKVVFINLLYDLVKKYGVSWETIRDAMSADHRIGRTHLDPIHKSGRGAGGNCFIKDMAAFRKLYEEKMSRDTAGILALSTIESKNIELLLNSNKDLDLLKRVYGENIDSI